MATATYDDRSFLLDDKRLWLVSGSIHYFRIPAALWRDRLLKAKRAGLNCISVYVAWNYHEPVEGQWELTGDKDVCAFIRLADELGLYVILRPGPYICAEWDFGGLPAWLTQKSGLAYRTSNAAYTHYYDKYFRKILPALADMQVTRGGNIILIQNENEYYMTTMPDRANYLEFISQLFRRSGFDIPIINCNLFSEPPLAESVECVNTWGKGVALLKRMRLRQPNAPLLVTEFWDGWFDCWGGEHQRKGAAETARRAMEILGCGSQYNYYMWHGGTNFGFWASRLTGGSGRYQTTSYDYDAPLAEGGALTEKYYLTRLVNLLANHMGRFFASSIMEQPGVTIHDGTSVLNLTGTLCNWAIVTNNGCDDVTTAQLTLPEGRELTVPLEPLGAAAIPVELDLSHDHMLDYCNLTPLGFFNEQLLVLHGPAGWNARVSINGEEVRAEVGDGDQPTVIKHAGINIALLNSGAAMRTWPTEDSLIIGPVFMGESSEELVHAPGAKQYYTLFPSGKITTHRVKSQAAARKSAPPRFGAWTRMAVCKEPQEKGDLEWTKIDGPRDVDSLGIHYGYVWYRIEIDEPRAKRRSLFLPDCEDRATLFVNGSRAGVWGRGDGAKRLPISVSLKRGVNVLTVLADNMGRVNIGPRLGERKGLFGHVYDAKPVKTSQFKLKAQDGFSKRLIPRQQTHLMESLSRLDVWSAEVSFSLTKVTPVHMSFENIAHSVAVICNERAVGFFAAESGNFGDVTLGAGLRKGKNVIKFAIWGSVKANDLKRVKFHSLSDSVTDKALWSFRPWEIPPASSSRSAAGLPAWYTAEFKYSKDSRPLFLHLGGARKGQIYLNGHNLGRHWSIGPQEEYYLPECWLDEKNELAVFDEEGKSPYVSKLVYRPLGQYAED